MSVIKLASDERYRRKVSEVSTTNEVPAEEGLRIAGGFQPCFKELQSVTGFRVEVDGFGTVNRMVIQEDGKVWDTNPIYSVLVRANGELRRLSDGVRFWSFEHFQSSLTTNINPDKIMDMEVLAIAEGYYGLDKPSDYLDHLAAHGRPYIQFDYPKLDLWHLVQMVDYEYHVRRNFLFLPPTLDEALEYFRSRW